MATKAFQFVGETLLGGGVFTEKYTKGDGDTGGNFSVQYKTEKEEKDYFVRVIDIEKAHQGRVRLYQCASSNNLKHSTTNVNFLKNAVTTTRYQKR